MPRLFPSLGRSRKNREQPQREYTRHHADYPVYDDRGQYEPQPYRQTSSSQRNVVPYMESRSPQGSWAEEVVEYPESYSGLGDHRRANTRRQHPSAHGYSMHSESTITPSVDYYEHHYDREDAVPIVQRESSLSRLQEAFADYEHGSRPVTQVNLPQTSSRASPRDTVLPSVTPSMRSAEVRNMYAGSHQPVLVPNTSVHSVEPEFVRSASQHRGRAEERRRSRSRQENYPRNRSPSSDGSLEDRTDYPPCVVVVERGRHGKKDTYYVIPGGAPVVFEDDEGNELTRVGDFSGRYKPQRQRPVIIEDDHGNEIGRLGFDDESSLDYAYRNRSDEDLRTQDREHGYRRGRRGYNDDSASKRSHRSRRYDEQEYHRRESPDYSDRRPASPSSNHNVVFIPPSTTSRASSQHSGTSSRRNRDYGRHYEPSHHSSNTSRSYESNSASVVHLDDFYRRRPSGSVSSGSSNARSYGSSRRR